MALSNYSELQAAIIKWLEQDDVTAVVEDFIALAESRFDRELRIEEMLADPSPTGTVAGGEIALPADFVELKALEIQSNPSVVSHYLPVTDYLASNARNQPGFTVYHTRLGNKLLVASSIGDYVLHYYQQIPRLSVASPTNWLLTKSPMLYLSASIVEAQPYLSDTAGEQRWLAIYQRTLDTLHAADQRGRYRPGARMRATSGPSRADGRWGYR